jgi:hypothetical protein
MLPDLRHGFRPMPGDAPVALRAQMEQLEVSRFG